SRSTDAATIIVRRPYDFAGERTRRLRSSNTRVLPHPSRRAASSAEIARSDALVRARRSVRSARSSFVVGVDFVSFGAPLCLERARTQALIATGSNRIAVLSQIHGTSPRSAASRTHATSIPKYSAAHSGDLSAVTALSGLKYANGLLARDTALSNSLLLP